MTQALTCNRRASTGGRKNTLKFNKMRKNGGNGVRQPLRALGKFCRVIEALQLPQRPWRSGPSALIVMQKPQSVCGFVAAALLAAGKE